VIDIWVALIALGFDLSAVHRLNTQRNDTLPDPRPAASALVAVNGATVTGVRRSATDARLDESGAESKRTIVFGSIIVAS